MIILLLLLVGGMLAVRCVRDCRIDSRGIITTGMALSTEIGHTRAAGNFDVLHYEFEYNGKTYHDAVALSGEGESWLRRTALPAKIRIKFVPDDPTLSWPPDIGGRDLLWMCVLVAIVFWGMAAYMTVRVILYMRIYLTKERAAIAQSNAG
jgi:hypothetical protein